MILPGSASLSTRVSADCVAARKRSTPRAMVGFTHRSSSAVTSASRPKGVQNQGTPAYGTRPSGVSVVIIARSAVERQIQSLKAGLDVRMLHS
jgi:hypothetical protein